MKRNTVIKQHIAVAICVGMALAVLAGCGGGGRNSTPAAEATARVVPTMPAAQFAAPTTMIRSSSDDEVTGTETMTDTEDIEAEATPEPAAQDEDLARGATIYANRECAECHGAEGEGVEGEGSAIAGTALTEAEFTDLLRTGGEIGPDHLYGPNAISPGGMTALHAWLQSLSPAE